MAENKLPGTPQEHGEPRETPPREWEEKKEGIPAPSPESPSSQKDAHEPPPIPERESTVPQNPNIESPPREPPATPEKPYASLVEGLKARRKAHENESREHPA